MQISKGTILLAEDDMSLAFMVKDTLEEEGYNVMHCSDGQMAINMFDKDKVDICLLDIMMPNKDGYVVARKIRQQTDVIPILFLSTKIHEDDKLKGYNTGADDYLTKPFSMLELLKKVEVFLRRTKKKYSDSILEFKLNKLRFSYTDLKIYTEKETFNLTQKEADLLKFFCEWPNKVLKREEVLMSVWGKDDFFLGRSMDVYISKLRKYFRSDPTIVLETIHGIGFRFTLPA
jgi:DNA-binding response OmpR family regulator